MTSWVFFIVFTGVGVALLLQRYATPLRKIPGPYLASLSDLWRFLVVKRNQMPHLSLRLHRTHGPLIRLGPSYVSASSPEAIHAIYRKGAGFQKSEIYGLLQLKLDGSELHNLFSTQDKAFHAGLKRHLGSLYAPKAAEAREPNIETAIKLLLKRLTDLSSGLKGVARIDLSDWMHYFAFETMSQVNFSCNFGFLEAGKDVGGICAMGHSNMRYFGLMSQMPSFERLYSRCMGFLSSRQQDPLFLWTMGLIEERKKLPRQSNDTLDSFLALHEDKPEHFPMRDVIAATYISVVTAHDVLAITLRALVYYIMKNDHVQKKLREEINDFEKSGKLSPQVKFLETSQMEYVNAVINETLRIHPSTGLIFERYVPVGGIELHGKYIPAGTTIGVNAWVSNRNEAVFGPEPDSFRPERWIDGSCEQLKEMKKWLFTFSAGARACIGRNLAMVEMTKLLVDLYRNFDFQLADQGQEWTFDGNWLTTQGRIDVLVKPLQRMGAEVQPHQWRPKKD